MDARGGAGLSRRTLVGTAAWSVPVISVATAAPAFALSTDPPALRVSGGGPGVLDANNIGDGSRGFAYVGPGTATAVTISYTFSGQTVTGEPLDLTGITCTNLPGGSTGTVPATWTLAPPAGGAATDVISFVESSGASLADGDSIGYTYPNFNVAFLNGGDGLGYGERVTAEIVVSATHDGATITAADTFLALRSPIELTVPDDTDVIVDDGSGGRAHRFHIDIRNRSAATAPGAVSIVLNPYRAPTTSSFTVVSSPGWSVPTVGTYDGGVTSIVTFDYSGDDVPADGSYGGGGLTIQVDPAVSGGQPDGSGYVAAIRADTTFQGVDVGTFDLSLNRPADPT